MFFYMNVRRRMPVLMPNIVKQEQPKLQSKQQPQRQLVSVHEAPMVAPMVAPILIHEKNESGEICDNNEKQVIVYNIGHEDVEECFPLPVLEEPVIEMLSKPAEIILLEKIEEVEEVGEEVVHVHELAEANVNKQVVQDIKKNNNKNSKNNNKKKNTKK